MGAIDEEKTHVLMVTFTMQGHLNPFINLAKRLVSKNIHVTIATVEHSGGVPYTTQNPNPMINLESFSDGLAADHERTRNFNLWHKELKSGGAQNLLNLIKKLQLEKKYSCIITNPFTPWVVDVAWQLHIPCAILWIQASAVYSIYYRYFMQTDSFPDLDKPDETVELPGLPVFKVSELPTFIFPNDKFRGMVYEVVQSLDKVKCVLGSSFYKLEEDITKSMESFKPIIPIGPIVSPFLLGDEEETIKANKSEDYCIEWLDKKPTSSVIYISFGSITFFTQKQIDSIAMALQNTKKMFLWVIRNSPSDQTLKVPEFLEDEIEKGNGLIVPWCSQERVLKHKSVACFMTHGGWNSTLETVVAGVPVIVYPGWTDQPVDAKLLSDVFKIGVKMNNSEEDGELKVEEVERCIVEVTEGPRATEMKKNAVELRKEARKTVDLGGSSDRNLNEFCSQVLGKVFT